MEIISLEKELKKNPELTKEDIDHLREWTSKEKCAPEAISDLQLALFLHSCDYCMETTKKTIKTNYLWRAEQPDFFTKRSPKLDPRLAITLDVLSFALLPKRTSEDELVLVIRVINNDPKDFYFLHTVKLFFMYMDMYLLQHGSSKGFIILYDCEPVTFALARKMQISAMKALFFYLQEAISYKLSAIHFMNMHPAFDFVFALFKPFIKGNLLNRMHFHKAGSTTLFAHIPPVSVPRHFNGEEDSSLVRLHEKAKEALQSYEPWFEEDELALAELAQILGVNKKQEENSFEINNSFRQLDFD